MIHINMKNKIKIEKKFIFLIYHNMIKIKRAVIGLVAVFVLAIILFMVCSVGKI